MHIAAQNASQRKQNVLNELKHLEEYSLRPVSETNDFIKARLEKLIAHAKVNPWWQTRLSATNEVNDLSTYLSQQPILQRRDLQLDFTSILVDIPGAVQSDFVTATTSGSTGKPVTVRKYLPSFARHNMAAQLLPFRWHQIDQSLPMLQLRWNGKGFFTTHTGPPFSYLGKTGPYKALKISEVSFEAIAETIEKEKIGILLCSPTALGELIKSTLQNGFDISVLQAVLTFSERLTAETREAILKLTGAKIIDRYSSEEVGLIAVDCPFENHLHLIPLHNYVEIVDESGQPCSVGQPGRVLVTGLNSYGMPLVRYELGDFASFGKDCSSGITYPVIVPEIFRMKETLIDNNGKVFTVSAAGSPSLKSAPINDFQVFLFKNSVVLAYFAEHELPQIIATEIIRELGERFRTSIPVLIKRVHKYSNLASWKRRDFIKVETDFYDAMSEDELFAFK